MLRPDFTQAKNYILQHKLLSLLAICVIGITLTLGLRHLSNQSTSKKSSNETYCAHAGSEQTTIV